MTKHTTCSDNMPAATGTHTPDALVRKASVAFVTGALVLSMVPTAALADTTGSTTAETTQSQQGGTPPEMPGSSSDSTAPSGTPGEPPSGGQGGAPDGGSAPAGGMAGADTMSFDYTGTYSGVVSASGSEQAVDGQEVSASEADQNAALTEDGGTLVVTNSQLTKSGDDTNGDNCNFYGLNSILLAVGDTSKATVTDSILSATSEGSNGIFATDGATIFARGDTISTTAGNSRGLDATYGGTIVADSMDITTQGDHCAGVATDRGGGNVSLTNSTLSTAGSGSPLLYSTGDIEVENVTGTATGSQIAGMEGLNTTLISNSTLESTQTDRTASDPVADGVIIYQSTSGDAESTTGEAATFQVVGSTLKSAIASGSMFYLTNTTANVVLQDTTLDFDSSAAALVTAEGNDSNNWGAAGSNGATVNFTGRSQELSGDAVADTISSLTMWLLDGTTWTGAATIVENAAGSTSEAPITVNVGSDSTWVVTSDSTASALNVAEGGRVVDADGNDVTIVANGKTVQSGTSGVTVTVTGSYGTTVDEDADVTQLASCGVDRSAFDEEMGTSTAFAFGDASASGTASASSAADAPTAADEAATASSGSWWDAIVSWFKGLFGMA